MKKSFFEYLECSTRQEKEEIANELKAFYNTLVGLENEYFMRARASKKRGKAYIDYIELVQRIGTLQRVFEILHIDYEIGTPFDDVIIPF